MALQEEINEIIKKHVDNLLFTKSDLEQQIAERQARLEEINKKIEVFFK